MISIQDRFRGCLLGGAIGDALGYPVEFMTGAEIQRRFGADGVTGLLCSGEKALISDDTQMTLFTVNGIEWAFERISERGIGDWISSGIYPAYVRWLATQGYEVPKGLLEAQSFEGESNFILSHKELWERRAPGNTCITALLSALEGGVVQHNSSKGCGAVMRVAPTGLLYYGNANSAFKLGAQTAKITHHHPIASAAAGSMAVIISRIVAGSNLAGAVNDAVQGKYTRNAEVRNALKAAYCYAKSDLPHDVAIKRLGGGWVAEEALAIAVYCAMATSTAEDALLLAVNHGGDSDSTGAVCGNIVGALYGLSGLREDWISGIELSEYITATADRLLTIAQRVKEEF